MGESEGDCISGDGNPNGICSLDKGVTGRPVVPVEGDDMRSLLYALLVLV